MTTEFEAKLEKERDAAYERGAREMRQRCREVAESWQYDGYHNDDPTELEAATSKAVEDVCVAIRNEIRALPLLSQPREVSQGEGQRTSELGTAAAVESAGRKR